MSLWVGSAMAKDGIFSKSEAESAFRPWWSTLQDYLVYALILVGLFALPTVTDILDCTTVYTNQTSPAHNSFVNKYCTRENLSLYVSYFPYILAVGPILVILIEKFFMHANAGGMKMQRFYALLVEDIVNKNDLFQIHREARRDIKELRNEFRASNSFLIGFVTKNVIELLSAVGFGVWLVLASFGNIFELKGDFELQVLSFESCQLVGVDFSCIVPNTHFYFSLLIASLVLVVLFALCCLYTLLWTFFKGLRKLSRHLSAYRKSIRQFSKEAKWDKERSSQALDVYGGLHSPDVALLLDLLAETMGVASAMRILTILDQEFHAAWKTTQIIGEDDIGTNKAIVTIEGATMGSYLGRYALNKLMYVALISPIQTIDTVQTFNHEPDETLLDHETAEGTKGKQIRKRRYKIPFEGLEAGTTYKVTIATTFNGKEVAENYISLTTRPIPPTNLTAHWGFDVRDNKVFFKTLIKWTPITHASCSYFVEVNEDDTSFHHETNEHEFEHFTTGLKNIKIRVWSVIEGTLRSQDSLDSTLSPVPDLLRDYVAHLTRILPVESIGSQYLYQVALLKQVSRDLRSLYADMKGSVPSPDSPPSTSVPSLRDNRLEAKDSLEEQFIGREASVKSGMTRVVTG
ncbi:hypothetical protein TCAL_15258 [Tigriopus californicus]|uniref:Uncharacterized protein n=1 Tax=Tigriopus californicus TaxID=6832 RepID=A0A553NEP1_TIGCA|nr:uncharacterized protein LOC131889076 isoform X1 [Tigriopus californicus]TRY63839.1 hypothetical protein TCAL_15258 [Tigriopus californicus]